MPDPLHHGLNQSRWPKRIGRLIDAICLVALIVVIVTVIYGFWLRAIWAHGRVAVSRGTGRGGTGERDAGSDTRRRVPASPTLR